MDDGVATVGVDGKVALLVGVDVDTSVSVDTKPIQNVVESIPTPPISVPSAPAPVKKTKKKVDKIIGGITGGSKKKKKKKNKK